MHRKLSNQLRDVLRSEELPARLTGICRIVRNQELIGITKQINLVLVKIPQLQPLNAFQNGGKTAVFVFDGVPQSIAGCIEIGKEAFDVSLGWITVGRAFNSDEDTI
ncbi:Uncharacterised protein [Enterobacter hormaechei]|nr:Uncharacterised protein [Enterobacter hormaechei]